MALHDALKDQLHAAGDLVHLLARIDVGVEQPQQEVGRADARRGSARRHVFEAVQDRFVELMDSHDNSRPKRSQFEVQRHA
jgi:hypothetical protein